MADPPGLDARLRALLVLIRHGESTWVAEGRFQGRGDPPLSPLGERQAVLVAARIADRSAGRSSPLLAGSPLGIWHSPLQRAAATAQAIASVQDVAPPLRPDVGLAEIDQGEWQGLAHHEVRARWAPTLDAWRTDPTAAQAPGGERLVEAQARVRDALWSIMAEMQPVTAPDPRSAGPAADETPWAILVAHDGILRLALMTLLGVPIERFWSFPFALCGISIVEIDDGRALLRAHNLVDHLATIVVAAERPDRGGAL